MDWEFAEDIPESGEVTVKSKQKKSSTKLPSVPKGASYEHETFALSHTFNGVARDIHYHRYHCPSDSCGYATVGCLSKTGAFNTLMGHLRRDHRGKQ